MLTCPPDSTQAPPYLPRGPVRARYCATRLLPPLCTRRLPVMAGRWHRTHGVHTEWTSGIAVVCGLDFARCPQTSHWLAFIPLDGRTPRRDPLMIDSAPVHARSTLARTLFDDSRQPSRAACSNTQAKATHLARRPVVDTRDPPYRVRGDHGRTGSPPLAARQNQGVQYSNCLKWKPEEMSALTVRTRWAEGGDSPGTRCTCT
ncbi:hypothetical protein C8T65DRAFT_32270 [Cerioporus squamosus]|nr:hypothetical protein C8T65DRAFT_32270 [Cerioporus squamosus]